MLQRIRKSNDEGFTLIELLIVIIILGILAAIVVFAVGSLRGDAVNAACKTDVKSIQLAAEAVKTKSGAYPQTQIVGANSIVATAASTNGAVLKAWPGGTAVTDDLFFTYLSSSPYTTYTLKVQGKNLANGSTTSTSTLLTQDSPDGPVGATTTPFSVERACEAN